jgi:hypothetical protein
VALLGIGFLSLNISSAIQKSAQADALLREEMEAVRAFRDGTNWSSDGLGSIVTGGAYLYHLVFDSQGNPPQWQVEQSVETLGEFNRYVFFESVQRDAQGNIASSGNVDPNTIKVTAVVAWADRSVQLASYFTNWR